MASVRKRDLSLDLDRVRNTPPTLGSTGGQPNAVKEAIIGTSNHARARRTYDGNNPARSTFSSDDWGLAR